jgi:hypothetical protein
MLTQDTQQVAETHNDSALIVGVIGLLLLAIGAYGYGGFYFTLLAIGAALVVLAAGRYARFQPED